MLDVAVGLMLGPPGGLDMLTRAGAARIIDGMGRSLVDGLDLLRERFAEVGWARV